MEGLNFDSTWAQQDTRQNYEHDYQMQAHGGSRQDTHLPAPYTGFYPMGASSGIVHEDRFFVQPAGYTEPQDRRLPSHGLLAPTSSMPFNVHGTSAMAPPDIAGPSVRQFGASSAQGGSLARQVLEPTKSLLDWGTMRDYIEQYYLDEDRTLEKTMELMSENHGFRAT